ARKINTCQEMLEQPAHEQRHDQMRRLQLAVGSGHAARLDGGETKLALVVGENAAKTPECGGLTLCALGMCVPAFRIGLPDLDHAVGDRLAVAFDNAAVYGHALPSDVLGSDRVHRKRHEADLDVR